MRLFDICKSYPITQRDERVLENEAFYLRAEVLKKTLDAAATDFVRTRCKCKAYYITPIQDLLDAWRAYCKETRCDQELNEYYNEDTSYYRLFGNISFGKGVYQYPQALPLNFHVLDKNEPAPEVIGDPQFYIGIRLIS